MRKQSFIFMLFILVCVAFASCKKKEEIKLSDGNEGISKGSPDDDKDDDKPIPGPVQCAYTIKPSDSEVDGSKLNLAPGSIVCIEAGDRGPLYLKNFKGEAGNPIIFINSSKGQTVFKGRGPWAIKVGYCSNIRITGTGSDDQYGIVVDGGHNGIALPELTTNFEIDHLEVKNCTFAGIMAKTDPSCDSKTWRNNYVMRNVSLHHNYIHDLDGEGFYIGNSFYNGRSESCGTVYPHTIEGLRVYKNIVKNTGCEGIQVGCATTDCEIYDNTIENPGKNPFAAYQNNGLQIGAGTGGKAYNNIIKNAPGNGIIVNGVGGNMIYNNVVLNSGGLGIFCDERTEIKEGFSFINNTIVNTGSDGIKLYSEKVPYNHVINNIIINPGTGKFINTSSGVKLTDQNNYFSEDIASAKFTNSSGGNYTLSSTSPAVNKGTNVSTYGIVKDFKGTARPFGGAFDIGAYEYSGK